MDTPPELEKAIQDAWDDGSRKTQNPYEWYCLITEKITDLYDESIWKLRDFVREDVEKVRGSPSQHLGYCAMSTDSRACESNSFCCPSEAPCVYDDSGPWTINADVLVNRNVRLSQQILSASTISQGISSIPTRHLKLP